MAVTNESVYNKLMKVGGQPVIPCVVATVVSVEGTVCTVKFPDGLELAGVRLKAAVDASKEYFILKPRVDSTVLLASLGRDDSVGEYYVVAVNEVDSVEGLINKTSWILDKSRLDLKVDSTRLLVESGTIRLQQADSVVTIFDGQVTIDSQKKVAIRNQSGDLNDVLKQIVGLSESMKVLTGSPGSLSPVSPTLQFNFIAVKKAIDDLLKP